MSPSLSTLWPGLDIPDRYRDMTCKEMIEEYQQTKDQRLVLWLIKKMDGKEKWLSAVVYSILKDYHKTEDIFQDLFIHLQKTLLEKEPPRNCRAWFVTVAKNRTFNLKNRDAKRPDIEKQNVTTTARPPEEALLNKIDAEKKLLEMKQDVAGIDQGWEIIVNKWKGESYTECANKLGITFTQFRGRYQRAQKILKEKHGLDFEKYFDWASYMKEES